MMSQKVNRCIKSHNVLPYVHLISTPPFSIKFWTGINLLLLWVLYNHDLRSQYICGIEEVDHDFRI